MDGALFIYIFYAWHATNCLHTLYHMQKKDLVCTQTKMHTCLCHTEHAKRHTHTYTQGLSPQYSNPFKAYLRVRVREHTFAHIPKFSTTLKESRTLRHNHSAGSISTSLNVHLAYFNDYMWTFCTTHECTPHISNVDHSKNVNVNQIPLRSGAKVEVSVRKANEDANEEHLEQLVILCNNISSKL